MAVDVTPLLPAVFWSGVIFFGVWLLVQALDAIPSFRQGPEALRGGQ